MNFNRNVGFNPMEFAKMKNSTANGSNSPVDKTAWFKAPEGLERFNTPTSKGTYKFDVVQFKLTNPLHEYFVKEMKNWDVSGKFWWWREISVHCMFPNYLPTSKNWSLKRENNDQIIKTVWDYQLEYTKFAPKSYTLFLIRMHPNETLGNKDYKFMYYLDTAGKLFKLLKKKWDEACDDYKTTPTEDNERKSGFYLFEKGCSLEVVFRMQESTAIDKKTGETVKFMGASDISFIPRVDEFTDKDIEFIQKLDLDSCIYKPTAEEYAKVAEGLILKNGLSNNAEVKPMVKPEESYSAPVKNIPAEKVKDEAFEEPKKEKSVEVSIKPSIPVEKKDEDTVFNDPPAKEKEDDPFIEWDLN